MTPQLPISLPDFLEEADDEVRVKGHRINLYHVLTEYNTGESPEGIALKLPTLKLSTVHKIVAFYLDHQREIDQYLAEYRKALEEQRVGGAHAPSKAELLRHLEQIRLRAHNAADLPY